MSRSHTTAASLFGHFAFLVSFSAALANLSCKQLGLKQKSHSRTRFHMFHQLWPLPGFHFNQNQSNMNLFLNSTCAKLQGLKFFDESLGLCVGPSTSAKAWWPLQSTACPESLALFSTKFSKAINGRKRSLGFLNGFAQAFPRLPSPSPLNLLHKMGGRRPSGWRPEASQVSLSKGASSFFTAWNNLPRCGCPKR